VETNSSLTLLKEIRDFLESISDSNTLIVERLDAIEARLSQADGLVGRLIHQSETETLNGIRYEPSVAESLGEIFTRNLSQKLDAIIDRLPEKDLDPLQE